MDSLHPYFQENKNWYKAHFIGQKRLPRKRKKQLKHQLAVKHAVSAILIGYEELAKMLDIGLE